MMELIGFPDAEQAVVALLANAYTTLAQPAPHVSTRIPTSAYPARFTRVLRTGGPADHRVIDRAQITVESYAHSEPDAALLASLNRAIINAACGEQINGVVFYRTDEASGPGNLPDPVTNLPRYSQTFTVCLRGSAL